MNYRNKRHSHQQKILSQVIEQTMLNKDFLKKIDFVGVLRKDLQTQQILWGIKPQKECTITSKCMAKFIEDSVQKWFRRHEKYKDFRESKYQISEEQIKSRLMRALILNVNPQDEQLFATKQTKINMLSTEEFAEVFVNRLNRILGSYLQKSRSESMHYETLSNITQMQCPSLQIQLSKCQLDNTIVSQESKNLKFFMQDKELTKTQEVLNTRRRPPMKKRSEQYLLKQSEATTIDPYTQHQSKQATPVSGRRVINAGTIISKESSGEEAKSGDTSPFRNFTKDPSQKLITFSNQQRKLSFQNLVQTRTPARRYPEASNIKSKENFMNSAKNQQQTPTSINFHQLANQYNQQFDDRQSSLSSIPFGYLTSNPGKYEQDIENCFKVTVQLENPFSISKQGSYMDIDNAYQNRLSINQSQDKKIEDSLESDEIGLMMDHTFLEKSYSTPIKQLIEGLPLTKFPDFNQIEEGVKITKNA